MAPFRRCFLDTSTLVAGTVDFGEVSRAPQQLMDALSAGQLKQPTTAWHCCLEFYAVLTRLPVEYRVTPAVAARLVREEIEPRFEVHGLPRRGRQTVWELAEREGTAGGRLYDLHIAEIARHSGADLVITENRRHFAPLLSRDIRVLTAADYWRTHS